MLDGQGIVGASGGRVMLKLLRIAVAVTSPIACIRLIPLWVRSYTWTDSITGTQLWSHSFILKSCWGRVVFDDFDYQKYASWERSSLPIRGYEIDYVRNSPMFVFRTEAEPFHLVRRAIVPYWFLVVLTGVTAVVLGIRQILMDAIAAVRYVFRRRPIRFSLRTMLIVMTTVAAWLGLISWLI